MFANAIGFFIQDNTNNNNIIRVKAGAPSGALTIESNGTVGLGTGFDDPKGPLGIETGAASSTMSFSNNSGSWKFSHNVNTGRFSIGREGGNTPFKVDPAANSNLVRIGYAGSDQVEVNGDLVVSGNCSETDGACADYVFGPDHERLSLPDLRAVAGES